MPRRSFAISLSRPKPERTLILGWNRRGPIITYELSRYVAPGSILTIAADTPDLEQEVAGLPVVGDNLSVSLPHHRHVEQHRARRRSTFLPTTTCSCSATARPWQRSPPIPARW